MQRHSHLHMAEQLAPCRWEKIQQHFYSSQQHHCWVCPSAAMPSDWEITAFSRHLGGEGQCPGKIQQNESKVTNGVKRILFNMITIRINRFLWIEFYGQWRAGAPRKIYLLSSEAAIWGAAWAPAFISAAVAGSLQSDHCVVAFIACVVMYRQQTKNKWKDGWEAPQSQAKEKNHRDKTL